MPIPQDHVLTPHGLVHKKCLAGGDDCPPITDLRALRPRTPGGWIESATYTPPEPLRSLSVCFTVPDCPKDTGCSVIYLFPAAENGGFSTILQPVLQWGDNGHFGGEQWMIACWHCTPLGHTHHSQPQPVNSGETLVASLKMTQMKATAADWLIEIAPKDDPTRSTALCADDVADLMLFVAGGALEVYSLAGPVPKLTQDRELFPQGGGVTFSDIAMHDLYGRRFFADWVRHIPEQQGFRVESLDPSVVTLTY